MNIYSILKSIYEDEICGFGIHPISYRTYKETYLYLLSKGYEDIGHNQFQIEDGNTAYVAEIVTTEF